jgi:hypothetical protein
MLHAAWNPRFAFACQPETCPLATATATVYQPPQQATPPSSRCFPNHHCRCALFNLELKNPAYLAFRACALCEFMLLLLFHCPLDMATTMAHCLLLLVLEMPPANAARVH